MSDQKLRVREMVVLRVVGKTVIPFVLLFALYVQFHGDFGPGGGFQAGVIFAAGLILYGIIFSPAELREAVSPAVVEGLAAFGLLLYGGVGLLGVAKGERFLDYSVLSHDPTHGQHYGILLVELGVGITVTAVMLAIYYSFTGRSRRTTEPMVHDEDHR